MVNKNGFHWGGTALDANMFGWIKKQKRIKKKKKKKKKILLNLLINNKTTLYKLDISKSIV